jgi:hypothetical protein
MENFNFVGLMQLELRLYSPVGVITLYDRGAAGEIILAGIQFLWACFRNTLIWLKFS